MPGTLAEAIAATNMAGRDPDLDARAVSWVQRIRDLFAPQREPYEREWAMSMRAYLTQSIGSNYAGHSNVILPTAFILNERVIPRVVAATVGRGIFFDAAAKTDDQQREARLQRDLLSYQLEECGFREKYTPLIRSTGIYGTGAAKRRWRYEEADVERVVKTDEPYGVGPGGIVMRPAYAKKTVRAVLFDGPDVDEKDLFTIFMDPRSAGSNDILEELKVTRTWLLRQARQGLLSMTQLQKVFDAQSQGGTGGSGGNPTSAAEVARNSALGQAIPPTRPGEQDFTYRECWCEFPLEAEVGREYEAETYPCLIVVVNGIPCRIVRNPMPDQKHPYLFPVFIQVPGRRYGLSLTATNLGLFIEKNDTRNMALDGKNLEMVPMMKSRDPKMQGKVMEIEPGRIVVDPSGSLGPINLNANTRSGYEAEAHLNRDLEDGFGAPSTMSGQPLTGGGGSATEVAATSQEGNSRIASYAYTVEETLLKKMLRGMAADNRSFLDTEKQVRIEGEEGQEFPFVTPLDVQAECDFVMLGSSQLMIRTVLGAQYAGLLPVMNVIETRRMAQGAAPMFEWTFLFRTLFRDVFNFPHPELVVLPTPSENLRPKNPREMMLLISQGHRPKIDLKSDLASTLGQFSRLLLAVEGRIDPALERKYREFLLDLKAAAEKKALVEMAARMAQLQGSDGGSPPGGPGGPPPGAPPEGPPPPTGPEQRDGQGLTPGRRLMVAARGGPPGQGVAA